VGDLKFADLTREEKQELEEAYWTGVHKDDHPRLYPGEYADVRDQAERFARAWAKLDPDIQSMIQEQLAANIVAAVDPVQLDVGRASMAVANAHRTPAGGRRIPGLRDLARAAQQMWIARKPDQVSLGNSGEEQDGKPRRYYPQCRFVADVFLSVAKHAYDDGTDVERTTRARTQAHGQLTELAKGREADSRD
jgi:hypothetical protein